MVTTYIYGEINETTALNFNKLARRKVDDINNKGLIVYINSNGGDYDSACSIIDTINLMSSRGMRVETVVDGKAYSAAAFIFCFGTIRSVHEHSSLMLHPIHYENTELSICEIKGAADFTSVVYLEILKDIVSHCNLKLSVEELYDKLRHGWWINGREALEYGIANQRIV